MYIFITFSKLVTNFSGGDGQSGSPTLISLELVDYVENTLSRNALKNLSNLQSLSVIYRHDCGVGSQCLLKEWLSNLHQLLDLRITNGFPLAAYADSIPATVTHLTLRVPMQPEDIVTVGVRVPSIHYLHFNPRGYSCGIGQIPHLFPNLRILKIRRQNVTKRDFMNLHQLQHLKSLEILDASTETTPSLLDQICQLHSLTNHKVNVITSVCKTDPLVCNCVKWIET